MTKQDGNIHKRKNGKGKTREHTFEEISSFWLEYNQIRCKGATISKYQYLIERHILPEFGKMKIQSVNEAAINAFLLEKLESGKIDQTGGLAPSYVQSMLHIINSILKFAASNQMRDPLKTPIFRPPIAKMELPLLSADSQRRLETNIIRNMELTGLGVLLSLHTGLRIGEVCALRWKEIDFDDKVIHIRHTVSRVNNRDKLLKRKSVLIIDTPKTRSSVRDIPISKRLEAVLKKCDPKNPEYYVMSNDIHFLSPRTYEHRYHRLLEKYGIEQINYHALRHTFATRCIEAGVDVKSLSEILGHANVGITLNTYVHSSMEFKRKQLEKLESLSI